MKVHTQTTTIPWTIGSGGGDGCGSIELRGDMRQGVQTTPPTAKGSNDGNGCGSIESCDDTQQATPPTQKATEAMGMAYRGGP